MENERMEYMISSRKNSDSCPNAFGFLSPHDVTFYFWGVNKLCHRFYIKQMMTKKQVEVMTDLFFMVILGKKWVIDIQGLEFVNSHLNVKKPIDTLCNLFYRHLPENPVGCLFKDGLDEFAMGILRKELTDINENGRTSTEILGLPEIILRKIHSKECLRFVSDKKKRNMLKKAVFRFVPKKEIEIELEWNVSQLRFVLECYRFNPQFFRYEIFHFLGGLSTKEAVIYHLYLQRRRLVSAYVSLPLVPEDTVDLLRLENAADKAHHFLANPGLSVLLAQHQSLHMDLLWKGKGFIFEFAGKSVEEMYLLAETFLPLDYINDFWDRVQNGNEHDIVMLVKDQGIKEKVVMCIVLKKDHTIKYISYINIPKVEEMLQFFDDIVIRKRLYYGPFFTKRIIKE